MRARSCLGGLVILLLALGVSGSRVSPPLRDATPSLERRQSPPSPSQALSDLDGDALTDAALIDTEGLQHTIELHLSRMDEWVVLPFSVEAEGDGSLSAQDVDGDGDTDLIWKETRPLPKVMLWLNDGAGRFECLCPLVPRDGGFALSGAGVRASHFRFPDGALSQKRDPSSGFGRTPGWDFSVAATPGSYGPEPVWTLSGLTRLPSNRSPPLLLC
jgi:hypothetical protein